MEARHELQYLQHGHVSHRALQINGSYMDIFTINLAHYLSGVNCMLELNVTACSTNIVGCMKTKSFKGDVSCTFPGLYLYHEAYLSYTDSFSPSVQPLGETGHLNCLFKPMSALCSDRWPPESCPLADFRQLVKLRKQTVEVRFHFFFSFCTWNGKFSNKSVHVRVRVWSENMRVDNAEWTAVCGHVQTIWCQHEEEIEANLQTKFRAGWILGFWL